MRRRIDSPVYLYGIIYRENMIYVLVFFFLVFEGSHFLHVEGIIYL